MRARLSVLVGGAAIALMCGCAGPVVAQAAFEIQPGSFVVSTSSDQAGAHADLTTSFAFQLSGKEAVGGLLRNVEVVLPVGFAGYPPAVKTCTPPQLELEECPADSQIGTIEVAVNTKPGLLLDTVTAAVYNMVPPPNETAVFGFLIAHFVSADIVVSVGPDYRLHATVEDALAPTEITRQSLTLWGVPADPSHDAQRGNDYECERYTGEGGVFLEERCTGGHVPADENPVPFLVNPTQCTEGPLTAELAVESWGESNHPSKRHLSARTPAANR